MTTELNNVEKDLKPIESEIISFAEQAKSLEIKTDEDYNGASDFISVINDKKKTIEKMRKFFVDPLNQQVKTINSMFKPQVEEADSIIKLVKGKMADHFQKKEEARIKEEARLQAIRDKANAKREAEGKEAIEEPVREVAEVDRTVATESSKTTVKKVWVHKVVSINALPDDVKKAIFEEAYRKGIVDTVIRKFVNAGVREMSGVEIKQEANINIR